MDISFQFHTVMFLLYGTSRKYQYRKDSHFFPVHALSSGSHLQPKAESTGLPSPSPPRPPPILTPPPAQPGLPPSAPAVHQAPYIHFLLHSFHHKSSLRAGRGHDFYLMLRGFVIPSCPSTSDPSGGSHIAGVPSMRLQLTPPCCLGGTPQSEITGFGQ